jgi:hypothetical protein
MRCVAVRKAWSQNLSGMNAVARKARHVSTMCLCLRSATPFCWCACGQDTLWVMPTMRKRN